MDRSLLALLRRIGKTSIVNPGSLGQPKDGDTRAPYAVWEDSKVELRRVAYPVEATVQAYSRTPLASSDVESLIAVLRTGGTLPRNCRKGDPGNVSDRCDNLDLITFKARYNPKQQVEGDHP